MLQFHLQTEKTWQHCTAEATAHSLLAKIFFTATNGSSHIASNHLMHHTQRHVQSHFKQKHILPSSNLSDGHENSVAFIACDIQQVPGSNASDMQRKWFTKTSTKHRTTLTAKKVVYQKLSAWLARCPWAPASWASAWQQRKTIKNRQLVTSWQTHCAKPAVSIPHSVGREWKHIRMQRRCEPNHVIS